MTDKLGVAMAVRPMNGSCAEYLRIIDMIRIKLDELATLNRLLDVHVIGMDNENDNPGSTI